MKNIANSKNGGQLANNHEETGYFPVMISGDGGGDSLGFFLTLLEPCGLTLGDPIHSTSLCFYLGPSEDTLSRDVVKFNQLLFKGRKIIG